MPSAYRLWPEKSLKQKHGENSCHIDDNQILLNARLVIAKAQRLFVCLYNTKTVKFYSLIMK